jgi:hypothetical protein
VEERGRAKWGRDDDRRVFEKNDSVERAERGKGGGGRRWCVRVEAGAGGEGAWHGGQ